MKKKILIGGFVIILFGTAVLQYKSSLPKQTAIPVVSIYTVKQMVTVDDKKRQATIHVKKGSTALQLLSISHKIIEKGEKENAYITEIDGRLASETNKEFWAFYVNGKQAQVGAGSYLIKNNDTIEWKIETY